ncbi:MAG TPA: DegT/DnrJ/EryC1/StrS family aminotransferase [Defluviitoga tunisiensis]|nr:DegT/DnrJ/EryC1/StrS family aminotransferase [Defluviitoga tunisiensis]
MWKVQLFKLNFDSQELNAVKDVLDSGWITMGPKTKEFEEKFSLFLGSNVKSLAVTNGTAALHMALLALGIKSDDEVIVPALTFVADINVVAMVGAKPILADCQSIDNWNVSAETIKKVITNKTKAIIIVHYAGYPCEMDDIINICKEKNIILIEDCAHSPGATYKGQQTGTFGDIGCFSFFSNKNLSVGEGGMVTTKNEELLKKLSYIRSHGMTSLSFDRLEGRIISYDVVMPGLNYRIDEIRSAIGIVQLKKLNDSNLRREKLVKRYIENLSDLSQINLPFVNIPEFVKPSYHIFPILIDKKFNRIELINFLKSKGIQTSIHYPSFRSFSYYHKLKLNFCPIAEEISERELTLPLYPTMDIEQVDYVCECLREYFELKK